MKNRNPFVVSSSIVLFFLIAFASCKKINEATELGTDLIPPVDNINTFSDTLAVETYNESFTDLNDSTRVARTVLHYLGQINNDPLFGKTAGSIFLELKPSVYKYAFEDHDAITIDSVVLVLSYKDLYGDSTIEQQVTVSEIAQSAAFKSDSFYLIRGTAFPTTRLLGVKTFQPKVLNDSVFAFREKAANQLRIRLDDNFGQELLTKDSTNAYLSDSAFRKYFKGFAITPTGGTGNAVMGFALADTNTKLSIYYNYVKGSKKDTTMRNFYFNASTSASANFVKREHTTGQINNYLTNSPTTVDEFGYIQNTPGTYVRVKIPGLANLSNRVIHRAELIVQQVAGDPVTDALYTAPTYMFIDAKIPDSDNDPNNDNYKAVPYDLTFNSDGSLNLTGLGAVSTKSFDQAGNSISVWRMNLSRFVQNIVNKRETVTDFRLSSPYYTKFLIGSSSNQIPVSPQINPTSTKYRVRVGGGTHTEQPMRLRIVYSNIP